MLLSLVAYVCCGAVAGVLAGLLGVGGGIVLVPMMVAIFPTVGVPAQYVQQMALGTSLASIMITSVSSARAHNARGAVHWDIFKAITPGILLGTFFGGLIATHMPTMFLKIFFICFILFVSAQMLSNYRPPASRDLPGKMGTAGVGGVIGLVSSFVGIGGGTLSVPFMTFCNPAPRRGYLCRHWLSHCRGRYAGLYRGRLGQARSASHVAGLCEPVGADRHCLGKFSHRAPGCQAFAFLACRQTQERFCMLFDPCGLEDDLGTVVA